MLFQAIDFGIKVIAKKKFFNVNSMYILYFTFSKKGIGKKKGPSKPQLFHTQKANGNSLRMCIDYDTYWQNQNTKRKLGKRKSNYWTFFRR